MNQEPNNLNQNNFNTQGNNGIPNNQPLNNQNFQQAQNQMNIEQPISQATNVLENSETNNQIFNQTIGINQPQQSTNQEALYSQPTSSAQQPIMQDTTSQSMNILESGNINTQNFNNTPPKKMNLGLILGIGAAVAIVGVGIVFCGKLLSNNTSNADSNLNSNTQNSINNNTEIEDTKTEKVEFENFLDEYIANLPNNEARTEFEYLFTTVQITGKLIERNMKDNNKKFEFDPTMEIPEEVAEKVDLSTLLNEISFDEHENYKITIDDDNATIEFDGIIFFPCKYGVLEVEDYIEKHNVIENEFME